MSRQSKNRQRIAAAKAITQLHKNGSKGPAQTTPKHGKKSRPSDGAFGGRVGKREERRPNPQPGRAAS
ncbi:hypothetical protein LA345_13100 [Burkholderia vietnamiensis]|nr:hypothetical protein [Burkholderia vietnamiensis]